MFQFGVVQGNVRISVGALSYAGELTLSVVADGSLRNLDAFAAGMAETLGDVHTRCQAVPVTGRVWQRSMESGKHG
jgi:hypothetical protein